MIHKLMNILGVLALATVLGTGGFIAYLFGAGKLNGPRVEIMARTLRGELDHVLTADPNAPASQPSHAGEGAVPTTEPADAPPRAAVRLERLELERMADNVRAQQELLDQTMRQVIETKEAVASSQTALEQREKALAASAADEGFQKELALVAGLKPAQAKAYIVRVWTERPADAVRLMVNLEERQAQRILEQMKTPEELQVMSGLLEQIRTRNPGAG